MLIDDYYRDVKSDQNSQGLAWLHSFSHMISSHYPVCQVTRKSQISLWRKQRDSILTTYFDWYGLPVRCVHVFIPVCVQNLKKTRQLQEYKN